MVEYSLCDASSIDEVMRFIGNHWANGHILSYDRELMDFMHCDERGGYSFVLARDNGRLVGIFGYISTGNYDGKLYNNADIWLVLWKSIGDIGVGLTMMDTVLKDRKTVSTLGMNPKVAPIYKRFGFDIVDLKQYYILNEYVSDFKIAQVNAKPEHICCAAEKNESHLIEIKPEDISALDIKSTARPYKSMVYVVNRYVKHPVYKYDIYGIKQHNALKALLIFRKVCVGEAACLRVVDIIGGYDESYDIYQDIQSLLIKENAEYVDCYNYGCSEKFFTDMGFSLNDFSNIIPNYFEPYVQENIPLKGAVLNTTDDPFVMFKGDCDQDRPSRR